MLTYYVTFSSALPLLTALCCLAYAPYGAMSNSRFGEHSGLYHLSKIVLGLALASLLYLTVFFYGPLNFHPAVHHLNLKPFVWVTECYDAGPDVMAAQLLLNIAMFLPYGLLLPIAAHVLRKPLGTLTVVLLTTVSIETFQYFIGRSADVDDVIMNFVGGALGYLLFTWLNRRLRLRLGGGICWAPRCARRRRGSAWRSRYENRSHCVCLPENAMAFFPQNFHQHVIAFRLEIRYNGGAQIERKRRQIHGSKGV